jgi:putative flippase GtrA
MLNEIRNYETKIRTRGKRWLLSAESETQPTGTQTPNQGTSSGWIMLQRHMRAVVSSKDAQQLFKFLIIGCTNFAVSFVVFYLCYERLQLATALLAVSGALGKDIQSWLAATGIASPDAALANILGYSLGTVNSFVWNRTWTFEKQSDTGKRFRKFVALNVLCLALSTAILMLLVDWLHWPYGIVWVGTMGFVTVLNFIGNKFWVFRDEIAAVATAT